MNRILSSNQTVAKLEASPVELRPSNKGSVFGGLLVISVIAATAGALVLLAPNMPWSTRMIMIAGVLLTLRFWGGFAVLIAMQADLYLREQPRSSSLQGPVGILTICIFVGLLMFINRNRNLLRQAASRPIRLIVNQLLSAIKGNWIFDSREALREVLQMAGSLIRGVAVIAVCVSLSQIVLRLLPTRRTLNRDLQQWFLDEASLQRCTLVALCMIAVWIILNEISWRQITREQARLYVRSIFLTLHHVDLRMIVRRRLKLRAKAARRRDSNIDQKVATQTAAPHLDHPTIDS